MLVLIFFFKLLSINLSSSNSIFEKYSLLSISAPLSVEVEPKQQVIKKNLFTVHWIFSLPGCGLWEAGQLQVQLQGEPGEGGRLAQERSEHRAQ